MLLGLRDNTNKGSTISCNDDHDLLNPSSLYVFRGLLSLASIFTVTSSRWRTEKLGLSQAEAEIWLESLRSR